MFVKLTRAYASVSSIVYSDKYTDDEYEYRHVSLPRELAQIIPKNYWDPKSETAVLRLLTEDEWRAIGIQQSLGWEHYEVHGTPYIPIYVLPRIHHASLSSTRAPHSALPSSEGLCSSPTTATQINSFIPTVSSYSRFSASCFKSLSNSLHLSNSPTFSPIQRK
jgi:hypothetical protein